MILFPDIDPVAIQLGPVAIHWYGLSYVVGIGLAWWFLKQRAADFGWTAEDVADVVFYAALGAVAGGRLGYMLFYNFDAYIANPAAIFAVWRGGMSFHGGVIGFIVAVWLFGRRSGRGFFAVSDFVVPAVPIGLALGRIANFVNQELWGAPSDLPWAVVFTHPAAGGIARHPTQLYEALAEGLLLFVVLWAVSRHKPSAGVVAGTFLVGYAVARGLVELVREPDAHIGYLYGGWLTMGQVLSLPMLLTGLAFWVLAARRR